MCAALIRDWLEMSEKDSGVHASTFFTLQTKSRQQVSPNGS